MQAIQQLLDIMARLRDPDSGCPWDRQQTFASLVPHTLEEAHEVADAIEQGDLVHLPDELGDLLFQVVFYAQIGQEADQFDFTTIVEKIIDKLVRRHPHVFGGDKIDSAEAQSRAWEQHKEKERRQSGRGSSSVLDGVSKTFPALTRAAKLQRRAARVGFDWPVIEGVVEKLYEELCELEEVIDADTGRQQDEIGDLLFTCVNLARHLGIDPESALRNANTKFEQRFKALERQFADVGGIEQASLDEMDKAWNTIKTFE